MVEDRRRPHRTKTEATNLPSKVQLRSPNWLRHTCTAVPRASILGSLAVEMDRLMAAGMTTSQLRWLVLMGYVEHAREVTGPHDSARRFEAGRSLTFPEKTCFLMTPVGLPLARNRARRLGDCSTARPEQRGSRLRRPAAVLGSAERRTVLRVGARIVKQYRVPAEPGSGAFSVPGGGVAAPHRRPAATQG